MTAIPLRDFGTSAAAFRAGPGGSNLMAAPTGAAPATDTTTHVTIGQGTGDWPLDPLATVSAHSSPPAVGGAASNHGWRDESYSAGSQASQPYLVTGAWTFTYQVALALTPTVAPTATLQVICYAVDPANGAREVFRHTSGIFTLATTAPGINVIDTFTPADFTLAAGEILQYEFWLNVVTNSVLNVAGTSMRFRAGAATGGLLTPSIQGSAMLLRATASLAESDIQASDLVARVGALSRSLAESDVQAVETLTNHFGALSRSLADLSLASDTLDRHYGAITRPLGDVALADDTVDRHYGTVTRNLADAALSTDAASRLVAVARAAAEAGVQAVDTLAHSYALSRAVTDPARASDEVSRIYSTQTSPQDRAFAEDLLFARFSGHADLAEEAHATDLVTTGHIDFRTIRESAPADDECPIIVSDTFTRPDAPALVMAETGQPWATNPGYLPVALQGERATGSGDPTAPDAISWDLVNAGLVAEPVSLIPYPTGAVGCLTYDDVILADSPVAYWRMSEGAGSTLYDELGAHDGTYSGSPRFGRVGPIIGDPGTAVKGGSASVPFSAALNPNGPFTVEMWARDGEIVSRASPANGYQMSAGLPTGTGEVRLWTFSVDPVSGSPAISSPATVGVWHHVVGVWDGVAPRIFVDAVEGSAGATSGFVPNPSAALGFDGADDRGRVAFYDYALTPVQIANHHSVGVAGRHPDYRTMTLYDGPEWYDRLTSAVDVDETGNGHVGTFTGTPVFGVPGAIAGDPDTAVDLSSGALHVPNTLPLHQDEPFSIECWVKNPTTGELMASGNPGIGVADGGWKLLSNLATTSWSAVVGGSPTGLQIFAPETDFTVFHQLVGIWTGTDIQLFVDGVLRASAPLADFVPETLADLILQLATLDEAAFYNYALSPAQVLAHFQHQTGPATCPTLGVGITGWAAPTIAPTGPAGLVALVLQLVATILGQQITNPTVSQPYVTFFTDDGSGHSFLIVNSGPTGAERIIVTPPLPHPIGERVQMSLTATDVIISSLDYLVAVPITAAEYAAVTGPSQTWYGLPLADGDQADGFLVGGGCEGLLAKYSYSRACVDAAPATDSILTGLNLARALMDLAPADDLTGRLIVRVRNLFDAAPASDMASEEFAQLFRFLTDRAYAADAAARVRTIVWRAGDPQVRWQAGEPRPRWRAGPPDKP